MSRRQGRASGPTALATIALGLCLALGGCTTADPGTPGGESTAPVAATTPAPSGDGNGSVASTPGATTAELTIFYVAVDDQGKSGPRIGCGDSLVATQTPPLAFSNQVEAAMKALLDDDSTTHGESGLLNAVAASNLRYVSSKVSGDEVAVDLTGSLSSGGTCDDPRIVGQLKYTAKVAAGVGNARILLNGVDIEKMLSQK